jgi:hypothetical protein
LRDRAVADGTTSSSLGGRVIGELAGDSMDGGATTTTMAAGGNGMSTSLAAALRRVRGGRPLPATSTRRLSSAISRLEQGRAQRRRHGEQSMSGSSSLNGSSLFESEVAQTKTRRVMSRGASSSSTSDTDDER